MSLERGGVTTDNALDVVSDINTVVVGSESLIISGFAVAVVFVASITWIVRVYWRRQRS
jgi:hypothetical protein